MQGTSVVYSNLTTGPENLGKSGEGKNYVKGTLTAKIFQRGGHKLGGIKARLHTHP